MLASPTCRTEALQIALVDDDTSILRSLARMIRLGGHHAETFACAEAFLFSLETWQPEVLLVDLRLPGMDGLALQASMHDQGLRIPTVFLSGRADIASSVRALRDGAIDFLEKPCDEFALFASLDRAAAIVRTERVEQAARRILADRVATLTHRERDVFCWVVTGRLNKQIAVALGTREKTIKVHRARVMAKMSAGSLADLVRMFDQLGEKLVRSYEAPRPPTAGEHPM